MSRTIRRKKEKYENNWWTPESFAEAREEFASGSWRQTLTYIAWNGETITRKRKWYHREVTSFASYEAWLAYEQAHLHSDAGYHRRGHGVPSWFVNAICERPFRAQEKQRLNRALNYDEFDDFAHPIFVKDAAWKYW